MSDDEYGFEYLLCVLTHGPTDSLERTLLSFSENVSPAPTRQVLLVDGPRPSFDLDDSTQHIVGVPLSDTDWTEGPVGFCRATRLLWTIAARELCPWVFWLEHDFVFERPVDLEPVAAALQANPDVAQMSLLRDPATDRERRHGVLPRSRARDEGGWLSHTAYLTTNPSLMRRDFMLHNPWPRYASECEGKFGIDLVERGYRFGVWGDGSQWVRHIGARTGTGY